ncbi:hypothetical protein FNH22_21325 [Fulvivirga sp. M361]|uniref:SusE domain-containing protein n=1 Tax=Fulvivirga sp. M361 TaxID=2594266 RepID=UPI00117AA34E|nr:SusE domain-containing protein [Fulvivirga sp. M361]TRX53053.1 hypothetical protein FNH22_21325 [Fulvivirga sp. M361]
MKNFDKLFSILLILLTFSCEEEENVTATGNWELQGASITAPADNFSVVLDDENPSELINFRWDAASNDQDYLITYKLILDRTEGDFSAPLLSQASDSEGTGLQAGITHLTMDQLLADLGLQVSESIHLKWAVKANALSKSEIASQSLTVTRFETETVPDALFISGSATEVGDAPSSAIPMIELRGADGARTNIFEIHTSLESGESFNFYTEQDAGARFFGGNSGELLNAGNPIAAPETGEYRIRADFNNSTYEFLKIDKWSIVGNVIDGGWGGDVPLQYQGNSVWSSSVTLVDAEPGEADKRFIFRANGDWDVVLKRIQGSTNELISESFGNDNGYGLEDVPVAELGRWHITLDLSAPTPTYIISEDNSAPTETPSALYLFADGTLVTELQKDGDIFSYGFLDMKPEVNYTLNEAQDGSGNTFSILGSLGQPDSENDRVIGTAGISTSGLPIGIDENQAYRLSFDFSTATLTWDYYNFKLFHWNDWDTRSELRMTYQGNYTWEITEPLTASYNSKFISPWDYDFGSENPTELTGTMVTGGGSNFMNVNEDGTYKVNITLSTDFMTGTYSFVKQ